MYVATDLVCGCPPKHAHTYEGRCRWCFVIAGNQHICDCVQPTREQREKEAKTCGRS